MCNLRRVSVSPGWAIAIATYLLTGACQAAEFSEEDACRMAKPQVQVDFPRKPNIFGVMMYDDLKVADSCKDFESISAQGTAEITVPFSYISPPVPGSPKSTFETRSVKYFFIRTDQGWKIKRRSEPF